MRKKINRTVAYFIVFFLSSGAVRAQSAEPSEKGQEYIDMAWNLIQEYNDSGLYYVDKALALAKENKDPELAVNALETRGLYKEIIEEDIQSAFDDYEIALELCQKYSLPNEGSIFITIGGMFHGVEDYDMSEFYYQKAVEKTDETGDTALYKFALFNLGLAYSSGEKYDKAEQTLLYCLEVYPGDEDINQMVNGNLANLAIRKEEYEKTEEYALKSINSTAGYYYGMTFAYLLNAKLELGDFSGTDTLLQICKDFAQNTRELSYLSYTNKEIGYYYETVGTLDSALKYHKLHNAYLDSMNIKARLEEAENAEKKYQLRQKEEEIDFLNQTTAFQKKEIAFNQKIRVGLIVIAILLIAFLFAIYSRYRTRNKTNQLLAVKNAELAELNTTKDKLFSILAHDLKNPVSAFKNITTAMSQQFDAIPEEKMRELIRHMRDSSTGLSHALNNLLEWSLSQQGRIDVNPEKILLKTESDEIQRLYELNLKAKELKLVNDFPEGTIIRSDRHILQMVLRNVVMNAIKFSETGGKITLSWNENSIIIQDEGSGIRAEDLDKIFRLGKNVDPGNANKGSGIGLILCKELMLKQGGNIKIESKYGEGTRVILIFGPNEH